MIDEYDALMLHLIFKLETIDIDNRNQLITETTELSNKFYTTLKEWLINDVKNTIISGHTLIARFGLFSFKRYLKITHYHII